MNIKSKLIPVLYYLVSLILTTPPCFSSLEDDLALLDNDFSTEWEGDLNLGLQTRNNVNLSESYIGLNAFWGNKVRAYVSTKLEHAFKDNTLGLNPNFQLSEFIREAYIEVRQINGSSVALVIGKQQVAFGQNYHQMPIWTNNPLQSLQEIEEVMGFTIELPTGLFGAFDYAELSLFETESGDLSIGSIDGISVRLSRQLAKNWLLTVSHAEMGNGPLKKESRSSIGLIGQSNDGFLIGWFEGMILTNNPTYPGFHYALTLGGSLNITRDTKVVAEFTYISKVVSEMAIGMQKDIGNNYSLGPEIRYTRLTGGANYLTFGINLQAAFSTGQSNGTYKKNSEKKKKKKKD